jgi:predicted nucleic acid-binding protein
VIAYLDASVILRVILGQPDAFRDLDQVELGVASSLVEVECLRTLDRVRLRAAVSDSALAGAREAVYRLMQEVELIAPSATILRAASQPMATPLGTLDAIHLATALRWIEARGRSLVVATHDSALALAARAHGLEVVGG